MTRSPETTSPKFIDGRALATRLQNELKLKRQKLAPEAPPPHLEVLLIGEDPASQIYVGAKTRTAQELGFSARTQQLSASITEKELRAIVERLNQDPRVHGILLQLPLPPHLPSDLFLELIDPRKDVDGFHPMNVGLLWRGEEERAFVPCTAQGVILLLEATQAKLRGKRAVVVGRSTIVGKPVSALLLQRGATVTVCHRGSEPLEQFTRDAEILVVAAGQRHLIGATHVREGAIVIDVGIHREKNTLCGDVDTSAVLSKVSRITPVPGGVGPMTIACLMQNTWKAYEQLN